MGLNQSATLSKFPARLFPAMMGQERGTVDVLNTWFCCEVTSKSQSSKRSLGEWKVLRAPAKNRGSEGRARCSSGVLSSQRPRGLTALHWQEMGNLAIKHSRVVTIDIVFGNSLIVFVQSTLSNCVRNQKEEREDREMKRGRKDRHQKVQGRK